MIKQPEEDHRLSVAEAIINARGTIRGHRDILNVHTDALAVQADTIETHTADIGGHETRIASHESQWVNGKNYSPAVTANENTDLYFVCVGTDNAMWLRQYIRSLGWQAWQSQGGYLTSGIGAAYDAEGYYVRFVARGSSGGGHQLMFSSIKIDTGAWSGWANMGGTLL